MALEKLTDALYSMITLSRVKRISVMQARSEIAELPEAFLFGKLNAYGVKGLHNLDIGKNPIVVNEEGSGQIIALLFSNQSVPYADMRHKKVRYFHVANMNGYVSVRKITSRKGAVRFELEGLVQNPENSRDYLAYFYRVSEIPTLS